MNQITTAPVLVSRHSRSNLPVAPKSPVAMIDQFVGTTESVLASKTVAPFMSQIATLPLVSRQTISAMLSALKSPVATIDHVVRTVPTEATEVTVTPSMNQSATCP